MCVPRTSAGLGVVSGIDVVLGFHVCDQTDALLEARPTLITHVGRLASVLALMDSQGVGAAESFLTESALMWLLPRMHSFMLPQRAHTSEPPPTQLAQKAFLLGDALLVVCAALWLGKERLLTEKALKGSLATVVVQMYLQEIVLGKLFTANLTPVPLQWLVSFFPRVGGSVGTQTSPRGEDL